MASYLPKAKQGFAALGSGFRLSRFRVGLPECAPVQKEVTGEIRRLEHQSRQGPSALSRLNMEPKEATSRVSGLVSEV